MDTRESKGHHTITAMDMCLKRWKQKKFDESDDEVSGGRSEVK